MLLSTAQVCVLWIVVKFIAVEIPQGLGPYRESRTSDQRAIVTRYQVKTIVRVEDVVLRNVT